MAAEKFWNDIINEVQLMSEEEFSNFANECEKTPEILLTSFGNNIYELLPADIETKISDVRTNNFIIA